MPVKRPMSRLPSPQNSPLRQVIKKREHNYSQTENISPFDFEGDQFEKLLDSDGSLLEHVKLNYVRAVNYVNQCHRLMNLWVDDTKNSKGDDHFLFKFPSVPNFLAVFGLLINDGRDRQANSIGSSLSPRNALTKTRLQCSKSECPLPQLQLIQSPTEAKDDDVDSELSRNYKAQLAESRRILKICQQKSKTSNDHLDSSSATTLKNNRPFERTKSIKPGKELVKFSNRTPTHINQNEDNLRPHSVQSKSVFSTASNSQNPDSKTSILRLNSLRSCQNVPEKLRNCHSAKSATERAPKTKLVGHEANQINQNGTPQIVSKMFTSIGTYKDGKSNCKIFESKTFSHPGNIFKNILKNSGSNMSNISSDISSDRKSNRKVTGVTSGNAKDNPEKMCCHKNHENCCPVKQIDFHHPLKLNERDLHSTDKNMLSNIGIFTENGDIRPDVIKFLKEDHKIRIEDCRNKQFRTYRRGQPNSNIHIARCIKNSTSDSILSGYSVSLQSSDIRSDSEV